MKYSTGRILTTHVGSLPRPTELLVQIKAQFDGSGHDPEELAKLCSQAVKDVVASQVEAGIDAVSDGEMGKQSYTQYVKHRLNGLGERGEEAGSRALIGVNQDYLDHQDYLESG